MMASEKSSEDRGSKRRPCIWNRLLQAKGTRMKILRKEGFGETARRSVWLLGRKRGGECSEVG